VTRARAVLLPSAGTNSAAVLRAAPPADAGPSPAAPLALHRCDLSRAVPLPLGHLLAHAARLLPPSPAERSRRVQLTACWPSARLAFLADHRVAGRALFPGAGYLEMAAAAAVALLPGAFAEPAARLLLTRVRFLAPLALPEPGGMALELVAEASAAGGAVRIFSRSAGSAATQLHATVRIGCLAPADTEPASAGAATPRAKAPLSADALRARTPTPLSTASLYTGLAAAGLQYGPSFR
jgi:hypothetical protein